VPAAAAAPESDGTLVRSPIVGTFYRSPDPNSPPFVSVGDAVKVGQVLCIIEAMKLMNEIEAEMAGEVTRIHPENGQPVQYGDPLFTIRSA
jgi:acetyl-CoA carboxylase biotin carboxyl carrier protein